MDVSVPLSSEEATSALGSITHSNDRIRSSESGAKTGAKARCVSKSGAAAPSVVRHFVPLLEAREGWPHSDRGMNGRSGTRTEVAMPAGITIIRVLIKTAFPQKRQKPDSAFKGTENLIRRGLH
jgi:hypothetical protein